MMSNALNDFWISDRPANRLAWAAAIGLLAFGIGNWGRASSTLERGRDDLRRVGPSLGDLNRQDRGYYEGLAVADPIADAARRPAALATQVGAAPAPPSVEPEPFCVLVDDVREYILKPSIDVTIAGRRWSTNVRGMRDGEYAVVKPPRTLRAALLGDSIANGWGVDDALRFEPRLERVLNEKSTAAGGPRIEILNFAVPGHGPAARCEHFSRIGSDFHPDIVIFESTTADIGWDELRLRVLLTRGVGREVGAFRELILRAGISYGSDIHEYERSLRPLRDELLDCVYREVAERAHSQAASCLLLILPRVGRSGDEAARANLKASALRAGLDEVADLGNVFDDLEPRSIAICQGDYHPNALGHARLADRIEEYLDHSAAWQNAWMRVANAAAASALSARGSTSTPNSSAADKQTRVENSE